MAITAFPALPPLFEQTPTAVEELMLARDVLEHATLFAVSQQDDAAAERNFNQLRPYYSDCAGMIPPSPRQALLTGLNLLRLLVQNRIAEFHTELELIPNEAHDDRHVAFCLDLESSLMEGAYNKIFAASGSIPTPDYAHFMTMLNATVRDEIAACVERGYTRLGVTDAARLLDVDAGGMDAGAEGARGEKRVRNARIKDELGVTLLYPTYREGLTAIADGDRTPFQE